ncbi:gas vesicle protein [Halobacteria archaeon AArc-curdl1]|uniref:Gas vesicle protein n=1 Tax=Natronosalvus hydrolyticus TaxID=2979988 RepID=A0AAP2ZA46_9EURY|nr:gas vesicle protein [Halobacteria archaeon AArc-curdl1]
MAEAETQSTEQCKALTESGNRCSREAIDDGFCHQHDEDDPIADEAKAEDEESGNSTAEESNVSQSESIEIETDQIDESDIEAVLTVRQTIEATAAKLIGRQLDGVTEIERRDDGWRGVVEVIERASIPDTQDILGRYAIEVSEDGEIEGYRRLDRYRRDDTSDRD